MGTVAIVAVIETVMAVILICITLGCLFNEDANTKEINKLIEKVEKLEKDKEEKEIIARYETEKTLRGIK